MELKKQKNIYLNQIDHQRELSCQHLHRPKHATAQTRPPHSRHITIVPPIPKTARALNTTAFKSQPSSICPIKMPNPLIGRYQRQKKKKNKPLKHKGRLTFSRPFQKNRFPFPKFSTPLHSLFPLHSVMFETILKFSCNRICFFSIERQPSDWFQSSGVTHLNSPLIFSIYSPKCTPAKSRCDRFLLLGNPFSLFQCLIFSPHLNTNTERWLWLQDFCLDKTK